jgi:uncharacterized cupin superfamily protein
VEVVPEARFEQTDAGLVPKSPGWFVLKAREARWAHREGRGDLLPFTGWSDEEAEQFFPQLGINLVVLAPGEPMAMYHWEADTEDFLVLEGEATLIVEGEERPLSRWDFVHCPPHTKHTIVGAGDGQSIVLAVGARAHQADEGWGGYPVDQTAIRRGAGVEEETTTPSEAYARFPRSHEAAYPDGALPGA